MVSEKCGDRYLTVLHELIEATVGGVFGEEFHRWRAFDLETWFFYPYGLSDH